MTDVLQPTTPPRRLLRATEVYSRTALSRATIWRMVKAATFPKPVTLGYNRIAWLEADVDAWIERQLSNPPAKRAPKAAAQSPVDAA